MDNERKNSGTLRADSPPVGTRHRIADTALALFNRDGEHAVTTNHIAREMRISPGNLYYYFSSKDAIIVALVDRLDVRFQGILALPEERLLTIEDALEYIRALAEMLYDYRFLFQSISSLTQRSTEIQAQYQSLSANIIAKAKLIYRGFVAAEFMTASDEDIHYISENSWLVLVYWLVHQRGLNTGALDKKIVLIGLRQLVALFNYMLKPEARTYLMQQLTLMESAVD